MSCEWVVNEYLRSFVPIAGVLYYINNRTTNRQQADNNYNLHMKKILLSLMLLPTVAFAQNESNGTGGAAQTAYLALSNGIDISYVTSGGSAGNSAVMRFSNAADYASGVTSPDQELRVRSNRSFKVAVRCDAGTFSYTGNSNGIADMPDESLWLKVTDNNTGGSLKAPFTNNSFAGLSNNNQDLLINGHNGDNQTFSVQYKCTPGFNLPAGTYTMNVIYTATQQ